MRVLGIDSQLHLVGASRSVCELEFRHLRIRGKVELTGLNYVTRRGAIYVWRRRLSAWVSQTTYMQISLRTPQPRFWQTL